jgi:hypothetical protein
MASRRPAELGGGSEGFDTVRFQPRASGAAGHHSLELGDLRELPGLDSPLFQTVADGVDREVEIMLLVGEALLLRRSHDFPIDDQRGRRVWVKGGDAEDLHCAPVASSTVTPPNYSPTFWE